MTEWDWAIVAAFLLYALFAGLRTRAAASQNLEEYFLAGRSLSGWKAGLSMAATQFAADTPLLVTGLVATAGIFALWRLWIYALAFLLMGFLLSSSWRRAGVLTDAELAEVRYGHEAAAWLRGVKAVYFGTIINCTVLAMVLLAATRLAEPFLLWHQWLPSGVFQVLQNCVQWVGVPFTVGGLEADLVWVHSTNNLLSIGVLVLVTLLYSTTGGLRSVVQTDLLQFGLGMVGSAIFAWIVVDHVGGLAALTDRIQEYFSPSAGLNLTAQEILAFTPFGAKDVRMMVLVMYGFQWLLQMNADGTGYLAQRSMACRTDQDARVAAVVFTVAQVLLRSLIWLPLALGLFVIFPPSPLDSLGTQYIALREHTFIQGIDTLLPPGVKGLMVVGMLAALASTVDTHLNWGASYWTNDLYRRFFCEGFLKRSPSARSLVWVARGSNLLILVVALSLVPWLSSIQTAWQISLLLGAGMGIVLVLRWVWWRITAWGELSCVIASLVLAPLLLWGLPDEEAVRLLIMGLGTGLIGILVSRLTKPEDPQRLQAFYERAHPPGFWGPVERQVPSHRADGVARFWRALSAMALTGLSVFCLLTGIGSWMVGSPPPPWLPWPGMWIGGLLVMGIGLCPVWIKLGFPPSDPALSEN